MLDIGHSGDALDLLVALMPCVAGYAEIGLGLLQHPATRLDDNPYASWIRNYGDEGYLQGVSAALALLETVWQQRGSKARITELSEIFTTATRLEAQFWQMGLNAAAGDPGVTAPGIEVRGLSLHVGDRRLFDNLSFTVPGGQWVSLLGASGAGKTSLLRVMAGLAPAPRGEVVASDGQPIQGRLAWMGQKRSALPWLSVRDNVALGARLRGEKVDRTRVAALLEQVELSSCADARPATLSGGMRQRAALARTLYEDRPIVLMDEPFSALDTLTRTRIQTLAATLLAGRTVVLITHDPQEACRLSHRLLVLSAADGDIDDSHHLAGTPPRAPDAPDLLIGQAAPAAAADEGPTMTGRLWRGGMVFGGLMLLWGLASRSGIPHFLLPSPMAVAEALWVNRAYLGWHTLITLSEILSGLALGVTLGVTLALGMILSPVCSAG